MIRVGISVEGTTEEEFVKRTLASHLSALDVHVQPVLIDRARNRGPGGGNVTIMRLAAEMAHLYLSFDAVTSLVDFYGFRDKGNRTVEQLEARLTDELVRRVGSDWNQERTIPYVQRHEFEGLLFSDVSAFSGMTDLLPDSMDALRQIRARFPCPEDINDDRETAPSKRIRKAIPRYRKAVHGPRLADTIGLSTIRQECPRFDAWVERLESLAE